MTQDVVSSLRDEINSLKNRVIALEFELEDLKKSQENNQNLVIYGPSKLNPPSLNDLDIRC